jgi:hypothetical protein
MQIIPLGKVIVPTPGTPVALPAIPNYTGRVHSIEVSQFAGSTGNTYFGKTGLVKSTGVGVIRNFLAPSATGSLDSYSTPVLDAVGNLLQLSEFLVDADNANQGLYITVTVK